MPRIVDHSVRRREIVEAFLRLTSRDGLESATSRAIALELGVATGALWHYFPNFDAVLRAAFDTVFTRTNERIGVATDGLEGLDGLRSMMREILPLTRETQDEARIVVSFWGRVASSEDLATQQANVGEVWRELMAGFINAAITAGQLRPDTPVIDLVDLLSSISTGQQVEFVTRSALGGEQRQLALLEHCLRPWLAS
ncbi:MAG: putative TetR-family transcriptional regulator [Glaciihabitans sp.]|nr:putative TetR-family transcriptional regulator [Glaciihabitans sp.]